MATKGAGTKIGEKADTWFAYAFDIKRGWMVTLIALAVGFVAGAILV